MPSNAREFAPQSTTGEQLHPPGDGSAAAHGSSPERAPGPDWFAIGFPIAWTVFRILVWAVVAVWMVPRLLDPIGGHGIARWLEHHVWVRLVSIPILGPLWLLAAFELRDETRQRAARSDLASGVGATLIHSSRIDPTLGITEGPGLRVPLGRWSMDIVTWVRKSTRRTVARVTIETSSTFSFAARAASREPAPLRGVQQSVLAFAVRQASGGEGDPRNAAISATLAYLGEAPVTLGDAAMDRAVVLRANQPGTARALLTTAAVASSLAAFDEQGRGWEWTLYPTTQPGRAEMRFECIGGVLDAERVRLVQTLMSAALEVLADAGS